MSGEVPAGPAFEVAASGRLDRGALVADVTLRNASGLGMAAVAVDGELAGARARQELGGLAPGAARVATLAFPLAQPRAGRYALLLRIEHRPEQPEDAPRRFQNACLLLSAGADVEPAVDVGPTLRAGPAVDARLGLAVLDVEGYVPLALRSRDGSRHRVRLLVLPPPGINVLDPPAEVDLAAGGTTELRLRLIRGAAARGRSHHICVAITPTDGPQERATLAEAEIEVAPDPALLPRLRVPLAAAGALLLAGAALFELVARRGAAR